MPFLGWWISELFHFSSIISIVVSAVFLRNYLEKNCHEDTIIGIEKFSHSLAIAMEYYIFIMLGVVAVVLNWKDNFDWELTLWTLFWCTITRPITIYTLTLFINLFRMKKISFLDQAIMSFSGLRGGIAFSLIVASSLHLSTNIPEKETFIQCTIVVVYVTNFIQGTLVGPMIELFKIEKEVIPKGASVATKCHKSVISQCN